jgi:hypothetical protein
MRIRGITVVAAVGLLALPALAGAASHLTATNVRIGNHPAYVRVVVDFDRKIPAREVEADTFTKRMATVRLNHPGVTTNTNGRTGDGVHVALQPGTQMLHISMTFAAYRLKYLSYAVVTGDRLAIDLWKSAPPSSPTQTCDGLSLSSWHVSKGSVSVHGTEHGIFENQFQVVVRGANGKVLGRRTGVHGPGTWGTTVHYMAAHWQHGTLEAVAFSAKDGAVECLAQRRVTLRAS